MPISGEIFILVKQFRAALCLTLSAALLIPYIPVSAAETKTVELVAVGDDLIHTPIYKSCKTRKGYTGYRRNYWHTQVLEPKISKYKSPRYP